MAIECSQAIAPGFFYELLRKIVAALKDLAPLWYGASNGCADSTALDKASMKIDDLQHGHMCHLLEYDTI